MQSLEESSSREKATPIQTVETLVQTGVHSSALIMHLSTLVRGTRVQRTDHALEHTRERHTSPDAKRLV